jgi:hypothetical protein
VDLRQRWLSCRLVTQLPSALAFTDGLTETGAFTSGLWIGTFLPAVIPRPDHEAVTGAMWARRNALMSVFKRPGANNRPLPTGRLLIHRARVEVGAEDVG